jgi:hypothetical protein
VPELEITAQLCASLDSLTGQLEREEKRRQQMTQAVRQVPLVGPSITTSSGIIDSPDLLKVKTGYYWSVRRLTLSGFTAGTCVVYRNSVNGEPMVPVQAAGVFTFGRGEMLLSPDDRIVVAATGITGYVQLNGAADCFEQWYLPYYIG